MTVQEAFDGIQQRMAENPAKLAGMNAVFQFDLTGEGGGQYNVTVKDGAGAINQGTAENPNITITMSASDFLDMIAGKLNSTAAFMSGKLKIKGDMGLAMKLQSLLG